MSEIHQFLKSLKNENNKKIKIKLPVIAFFPWYPDIISYVPRGYDEPKPIIDDDRTLELDILKLPNFKSDEEVEKYLFKIIEIAKESCINGENYQKFIDRIENYGKIIRTIDTIKRIGYLISALWPFRKW